MRNVALDLSASAIEWAEASDGEILGVGRASGLEDLREVLGTKPVRIAFEACRESWHVHAVLEGWGHQPVMVDTTRVKQLGVGHHGRKNDRLDAEALALALDRGWVPEAHVLSVRGHALRELQEMHRALSDTRKRMVTHVRGLLRGRGVSVPSCGTEQFYANVTAAELPIELRQLVQPLLDVLHAIEPQLATVDLRLAELLMNDERHKDEAVRLASAAGVSLLVAAAFVSVVDDPARFEHAGQVPSYLGLCPRESTTGYRQKLGSITKHGNSYARWMLVQAAWAIVRSRQTSDPLVRWAHKVKQRRGGMKAAVAVARRLSRILWALWRDGTAYDPQVISRKQRGNAPDKRDGKPLDNSSEISRKRGEQKLRKQCRKLERAASRSRPSPRAATGSVSRCSGASRASR